jgi:hypothetical protein
MQYEDMRIINNLFTKRSESYRPSYLAALAIQARNSRSRAHSARRSS